MIGWNGYKLRDPDNISTPAMLVFREVMENNIALCNRIGGTENLMVHVKTHKSLEVTRIQLEAGVAGFKASTLRELEMVLEAGAKVAVLAYPLAQARKAERLAKLCAAHPDAAVHAIVSKPLHVKLLEGAGARHGQPLKALLDLDVGMSRTGVAPGQGAEEIYRSLHEGEHVEATGLHAYDGHDHEPNPARREILAAAHIEEVKRFRDLARGQGWSVDLIVGGGTFSFPYYAREEGMFGSPGNFIYWDAHYADLMPDMPFRWAAFVLTQVVDSYPERGLFTTDLGNKAVAPDRPIPERAVLPNLPNAQLRAQNEEHGVFEITGEVPKVGSYLLAAPGHVCPTTIKYPHSLWIDSDGNVTGVNEHTARDRG